MNMTTFSPLGTGKGEYRRKRGGDISLSTTSRTTIAT